MRKSDSSRRRFMKRAFASAAGATLVPSLNSLVYAAPKEGWIRLFDGETLQGWHKNRKKIGHGTGGAWLVEDGAITGEQDPPGSGNGGILLTDKNFHDFELLIEIKPDWGVCSGLFLRSTEMGQCIQMMVDYHNNGNVGHLYGEGTFAFRTRTFDINEVTDDQNELVGLRTDNYTSATDLGLIRSCTPDEFVKAWKMDGWNATRVRVTGKDPRVTTWINDLKVCDFDGATTTNDVYSKNRSEILKLIGGQGSIAVQVHGGGGWPVGKKCRWKGIKIRPMT